MWPSASTDDVESRPKKHVFHACSFTHSDISP
jgi:hypothetical protein